MLSLETIREMSREAAERAAEDGMEPFVFWDSAEVDGCPPFPFPNLGDYVPHGWHLVDELFCDSSGLGSEREPALTAGQLIEEIKARLAAKNGQLIGFGITEVGQFQLYVGVFEKGGAS